MLSFLALCVVWIHNAYGQLTINDLELAMPDGCERIVPVTISNPTNEDYTVMGVTGDFIFASLYTQTSDVFPFVIPAGGTHELQFRCKNDNRTGGEFIQFWGTGSVNQIPGGGRIGTLLYTALPQYMGTIPKPEIRGVESITATSFTAKWRQWANYELTDYFCSSLDVILEVSTSQNFEQSLTTVHDIVGGASSLQVTNLTPSTTYYWRVKYHKTPSGSEWSDIASVTTTDSNIPTLFSPVEGDFTVSAFGGSQPAHTSDSPWSFWQHATGHHNENSGIGSANDTYFWDINKNYPSHNSDVGENIYPVADGYIVAPTSGSLSAWRGNSSGQLLIRHENPDGSVWYSAYLHCDLTISKIDGTFISRNTSIGTISDVGTSNEHLHFGVYEMENGVLVSKNVEFEVRLPDTGGGRNPPEPTEFGLYGETIELAPNTSGSAYFLVKNMGSLTNFGYQATVNSTHPNLTITGISSPDFSAGFMSFGSNVSFSNSTIIIPESAQFLKVDFEVGNDAPIGEEIKISLEDLMVINPTTWEMIDAQTTPIKITVKEPKFDLTVNIQSPKNNLTFNGNLKITESGSIVFEEVTDNGTAIVSLDADKTYNAFISRQEPSLMGLNISDVARTQAFSLGMIPLDWKQQVAADVDGNGLVTIRDVMLIQGKSIGKPMPADANFDYVFVQNLDYSGTAISDIPTSTDVLMDVNQVLDFIVIRRGDLDHSGFPNTSNGKIEIEQIPFSITENEEFIEIKAVKNISLTGLDLRTKNGTNFKSNLLNFTENDVFQNRLSYAPQNTTDFQAGDLVVKFQGSTQDLKLEISNERFHLANGHLEFNKADANLVVYPNPSNNGIFNLVGLPFEAKISVWDTTGKKLLSSNTVSKLDLSSFESGIYILKIQTNNTTFTKKIILH